MRRPKFKTGDIVVNQNDEDDIRQIVGVEKGNYLYENPGYASGVGTVSIMVMEDEYRRQKKNNEWYRKMSQKSFLHNDD